MLGEPEPSWAGLGWLGLSWTTTLYAYRLYFIITWIAQWLFKCKKKKNGEIWVQLCVGRHPKIYQRGALGGRRDAWTVVVAVLIVPLLKKGLTCAHSISIFFTFPIQTLVFLACNTYKPGGVYVTVASSTFANVLLQHRFYLAGKQTLALVLLTNLVTSVQAGGAGGGLLLPEKRTRQKPRRTHVRTLSWLEMPSDLPGSWLVSFVSNPR